MSNPTTGPLMVLTGTCVVCGASRTDTDAICDCGASRPPSGWAPEQQGAPSPTDADEPDKGPSDTRDAQAEDYVGTRLPDPEGWLIRKRLSDHGPVAVYRVLAPPNRPPPKHAAAQVVLDPDFREAAIQRSVALANIRHPAVPRVLGMGQLQDGSPYRVDMPTSGVDARAHLGEYGPLSLATVLEIGQTLAATIGELHGRGLVHGHLCLDNVVFQEGDEKNPIIVGLPAAPAGPWLPHAAPEVQLGAAPDPRVDIFGLGYVLLSLLRGAAADGAGRDPAWRKGTAGPAFAIPRGQHLPSEVHELFERMIDRDPDRRPSSAVEVAMALRYKPVDALPVTQRPLPPWVPAVVIGGFVMLGVMWTAVTLSESSAPAAAPTEPVGAVATPPVQQPPPTADATPTEPGTPDNHDEGSTEPDVAPAVPKQPADGSDDPEQDQAPSADATQAQAQAQADDPEDRYSNPAALSGTWIGEFAGSNPMELDLVFSNDRLFGAALVPPLDSADGSPSDAETNDNGMVERPVSGSYALGNGAGELDIVVGGAGPELRFTGLFIGPNASGAAHRDGVEVGTWSARLAD